jgi:hypothetical protein
MFATEILMQCMGVGMIIIIVIVIVTMVRGWIQRNIRVGQWSHLHTGTCLCLNKNPEGELFFPRTTLLQDAILAKDDCGCEQDMTWKNQQM